MDKRTNRRQRPPDELVSQYREIGIPAVAAAARYQSPDRAGPRPRRQEPAREQSEDNPQDKPQDNLPAARRAGSLR